MLPRMQCERQTCRGIGTPESDAALLEQSTLAAEKQVCRFDRSSMSDRERNQADKVEQRSNDDLKESDRACDHAQQIEDASTLRMQPGHPPAIQGYPLHLIEKRELAYASASQADCAIRFVLATVLGRKEIALDVPMATAPKRQPQILACRSHPPARALPQPAGAHALDSQVRYQSVPIGSLCRVLAVMETAHRLAIERDNAFGDIGQTGNSVVQAPLEDRRTSASPERQFVSCASRSPRS